MQDLFGGVQDPKILEVYINHDRNYAACHGAPIRDIANEGKASKEKLSVEIPVKPP